MAISPHNKFSYRFGLTRCESGKWEITDYAMDKDNVKELTTEVEIHLADKIEVLQESSRIQDRMIARLQNRLRDHGIPFWLLSDDTIERNLYEQLKAKFEPKPQG